MRQSSAAFTGFTVWSAKGIALGVTFAGRHGHANGRSINQLAERKTVEDCRSPRRWRDGHCPCSGGYGFVGMDSPLGEGLEGERINQVRLTHHFCVPGNYPRSSR